MSSDMDPVAIVATILFAALTAVSVLQTTKYRATYLWTLCLGALLLFISSVLDITYSRSLDWDAELSGGILDVPIVSLHLHVLGSSFITSSVFISYHRLVWWVTPLQHLTRQTLWLGQWQGHYWLHGVLFIATALQLLGGSDILTLIGLCISIVLLTYFLVVVIRFRLLNSDWSPAAGPQIREPGDDDCGRAYAWRNLNVALSGLAALLLARTCLSFAALVSLGYQNFWKLYLFDALPIMLCCAFFCFFFPGSYLPRGYVGLRFDKEHAEQTKKADIRVEELIREEQGGKS